MQKFNEINYITRDPHIMKSLREAHLHSNKATLDTIAIPLGSEIAADYILEANGTWVPKPSATIADGSITLAKLADLANKTYIGRHTVGTGVPEAVTITDLKTDLVLSNVNDTPDAIKNVATAATLTTPRAIQGVLFDGSAAISPILVGHVVAPDFTTSSAVLVDITGLVLALSANKTYVFVAELMCAVTAVTTGSQYGVNFSAVGGTLSPTIVFGTPTNTSFSYQNITALNTPSGLLLTTSNQSGYVRITGIIAVGPNAGNFSIQVAKKISGSTTVFVGSYLTMYQIA